MVVHLALLEIGAPHRLVKVDFDKDEQHSAAYLQINPRGHVPTLVEDRVLHQDIELVAGLVRSGEVLAAVERDLGPLE